MKTADHPLHDAAFQRLFGAQLFSLTGTGLTTIALALLAWDLGQLNLDQLGLSTGSDGLLGAGAILGTALAIKMIAYLTVAPLVGGLAHRFQSGRGRQVWLISLDLIRALLVGLMPWVTDVWQLFVLMFFLNVCSAGFTPVYQALLPDVLPDEKRYTEALSLSRLAMELENLLSPALAALILLSLPYTTLFELNSLGFLISALLIALTAWPQSQASDRDDTLLRNVGFGLRAYLVTPRLRGLLALHLSVAATGSMVIVNSVVYVRSQLGLDEESLAMLMMASGAGAMLGALLLPRLLSYRSDRSVMLSGGFLGSLALFGGLTAPDYAGLFPLWFLIGLGGSLVLTPSGRLLRLSCRASDRSALFAANFTLSHAMWLLCYPLAGLLGGAETLNQAFLILGLIALAGTVLAWRLWPEEDPDKLWHEHPELRHNHPHTHDEHHQHHHEGWEGPEPHVHPHQHPKTRHSHPFVIDAHHPHWPQ